MNTVRSDRRSTTLFASGIALMLALVVSTADARESQLREVLRDIGNATLEAEPLVERIDAAFRREVDEDLIADDSLARAYLDAAALVAQRSLPGVAAGYCRDADLWAKSPGLRARARFNYAQIRYGQAVDAMTPSEEQPAPDIETAKARLLESARAFRAVLDIDPSDAESARNTERVRRMIQMLDEYQQQAQDKADQMRQQADELDELADRQQQESMQNDQQTQANETARQDQSDISEETEQQSQNMKESQPGSDAQKRLDEAMSQQEEAEKQLQEGDSEKASDAQREAAEKLRQAAEALREEADQQEGKQQESEDESGESGEEQPQPEAEPGEEEGESRSDRFSDWLLDREQRQREERDRQLRSMRGRAVPVERDW